MLQLHPSMLRPLTSIARSTLRPRVLHINLLVSSPSFPRAFSNLSSKKPSSILDALKQQATKSWAQHQYPKGSRFLQLDRETLRNSGEHSAFSWQRFGVTTAGVAAAVVVLEAIFNRDTRAPLSLAERTYLNDSFKYTAGGLLVTAFTARQMFRSGFAFRIMAANPWVVLGVSLFGSIATMAGTMYTPPERPIQKHLLWLAFNVCQAATLSPLFFLSPSILSRAALYTVGVAGSISYIGATATNDKYLHLGGPLLAGVTVVALSSLAPMILPMGLRSLAISEHISLYGGLAVFGGFILYDTQKILQHARMAEMGLLKPDALNESIGLELDMLNIFIRIVQILSRQQNKK